MQRNSDLKIRLPTETLRRIEKLMAKDPKCPSKNHWMLEIIENVLDYADAEVERKKQIKGKK